MSDVMEANFSSLGRDLFWSLYDMDDGFIRWSGYNDAFWWNEVSKAERFTHKTGQKTGRVYVLEPETNKVTIAAMSGGEGE